MKGCLSAIGVLVLALIVGSFFMPSSLDLAVNKKLEASPQQVFAQVNNLKNWENWSFWNQMDKSMTTTYSDQTVGAGASYSWDGKKTGKGSLTILESDPNKGIKSQMFFEGEEEESFSDFTIEPTEDGGSNVIWDFKSDYRSQLPWKRYQNAIGKMMVTKAYVKGLERMDAYIKAHPEAPIKDTESTSNLKIEEVVQDSFIAITAMQKGKWSEFSSAAYENGFGEAMAEIEKLGAKPNGYPFAQWVAWDTVADYYELLLGVPVDAKGENFGGTKALKASYYGSYEGMDNAYQALQNQGNSLGYTLGEPMEVFITDPTEELDTSKWLTEIYFPIEK
ncbi:MAG: SRPBCC family protein [Chitinophagales bacterium]